MPFVEKYGKKFYDKFMEFPDYIKGHMNPKEKETFIKEGKPSIKRYMMGDIELLNELDVATRVGIDDDNNGWDSR